MLSTQAYEAALAGDCDVVRELLGEGAFDVNGALTTPGQWTALLLGADRGHLALVNLLIEAGAKVDLATKAGATPLLIASQNGKLGVVKALIKATLETRTRGIQPLFHG